ncbi:MAG: serine/threonine-protein kinase [Fibrobacterota bacterium]
MASIIGRHFGKYFVEKELGKGGMATVYLALHQDLGRRVALKIMHPHLATDKDARTRFENEAKAIARLEHVNILQIYDYGNWEDNFYIAMELVEGKDAEKVLKENGPLPPEVTAVIFCGIAGGLYEAHRHGIIHRDIKLSNIILRTDGLAKLSDFGIVKMEDGVSLTQSHSIVGTPFYISPEQVEGGKPSVQSDIFAFGVAMYYALAGQYPYKADTVHVVLSAIATGKSLPLKDCGVYVPSELVMVVEKCMAREPQKRYENAALLAQDLNAFLYRRQLANDKSEVESYLRNPSGYSEALKESSVKLKMGRANTFKEKGLAFEALREYESILDEEPGNSQVRRLVSELRVTAMTPDRTDVNLATMVIPRKKSRVSFVIAGAALLLLTCALIYIGVLRSQPAPPSKAVDAIADSFFKANAGMFDSPARPDTAAPRAVPPLVRPEKRTQALPASVRNALKKETQTVPVDSLPAATPDSASAVAAVPSAPPCSGTLFVVLENLWGTLYVNNVKYGNAPTKNKLDFPCGTYPLRIETVSGRQYTATVTIVSGEDLKLQIRESEFK